MTIKDLKKNYQIYKRDNQFRISSLTEHGRFPHKYLCSAEGNGYKYNVIGYPPTADINEFKNQVDDYVSKLDYSSEYYNPDVVEGAGHIWFAHDYLRGLGFRMGGYGEPDSYIYDPKDIYGGNTTKFYISFNGLDTGFMSPQNMEEITINLSGMGPSWMSVTVKRTYKDIQEGIDSLLAPLLTFEAGQNLKTASKCEVGDVDYIQKSIEGLNAKSKNYKQELKAKLLEMVESL